jgi:DNA-binding NarL/FixJ family response regulator
MIAPAIHVLLIEDNPGDAHLVQEYLTVGEDVSFALECAERLAVGLERLLRGGIDLVLLDLSLPDSHGLDTLDRLVSQAPTVPVVILTGHQEDNLGLESIGRGAQDYLVKGQFTGPVLKRTLRYSVERCRAGAKLREQEAQLRMLTERLPAILWTTDRDLRFTSSMGSGIQRLNLLPGAPPYETLYDLFKTQDAGFPAIDAHGRALQGESVLYEIDWSGRTLQIRVEPLLQGQHIIGTIGVALDITDHRRVEEEFRLARQIQQGLLPRSMPTLPNLQFGGCSYPANATGGDFFDCMRLGDGSVGLVIGDASGHGFGPALLAAVTHASLHTLALAGKLVDLGAMLDASNRLLCEDAGDGLFVTLLFARFDPATRTLTYSNAGHQPGLILDPAGAVRARLDSTGLPLGLMPGETFPTAPPVALADGDLVLFVTDGLLDATSPEDAPFGMDRALEIVRNHRGRSAQEIANALCGAARAFCQGKPHHDDITAAVVNVTST